MKNSEAFAREKRLLLEVISRLAPVRTITSPDASQQITICYEDNAKLRPVTEVVRRFRGHFQWIPLQQLPYICLVPVSQHQVSRAASDVSLAARMALEDMAALSATIEQELALAGLPSQGVEFTGLPEAHLLSGQGGVCLVADPERFLEHAFLPTSTRDKMTDLWPSEAQLEDLYGWVEHKDATASPLLTRIAQSGYGDLIILPGEVSKLRSECASLLNEPSLADVLAKLLSLCDLAEREQLGIVSLGQ